MAIAHSFHIPVMGIGFTVDTPLKVSQYGIDSVISIVDDMLLEKLRKLYCEKFELPYKEISNKLEDFRAKRITSYLNLMNKLADKKFEELKTKGAEVKKYFGMLPDTSSLKQEFKKLTENNFNLEDISSWLRENLSIGSIDVNIMTKIDKENYLKGEKLPIMYNDAHAALRGFAQSDLNASVVLSAGMNPRLYSYIENFEDFYPDENGNIKKRIILKVSDYRSALIQGRFFAKKGLWVSEYRIESGLNCGGHAFATEGFLMGPILEEFKKNREQLCRMANDVIAQALETKGKPAPENGLQFTITAQGGVGTNEEHDFIMDNYNIDRIGWGSPFLLVPEASSVDDETRELLQSAKEEDLYLSGISPLGVPFNSLRGNTKDVAKLELIEKGKPGSGCPKQFLALNKDEKGKNICTASTKFQRAKIKELDTQNLSKNDYKKKFDKIVEKACICVGLGTASLIEYDLDRKIEGPGVSVCPGPNMAYYDKKLSLSEMIDHIYGRANVITVQNRPNVFIKELNVYIDYLKNLIDDTTEDVTAKQEKYLNSFANNLNEGIQYYSELFDGLKNRFEETKFTIFNELEQSSKALGNLKLKIQNI